MFTTSEYGFIEEEYTKLLDSKTKKPKVVSSRLFMIFAILIILVLFSGIMKNEPWDLIVPIVGSIIFLILIIFLLISFKYTSEKPFYEYIVKKIIDKINYNLDLNIQQMEIVKTKYDFNSKGGIFTRFSSTKVRMHLQGHSVHGKPFDLYETILITSDGKTQTTHLNGVYIVTPSNENFYQQIRTNGSPHLKGNKYDLIEKTDEFRNYLDKDTKMISVNDQYVNLFKKLHQSLGYKKAYMSIVEKEVHFAIQPVKLYEYKELSFEKINEAYDEIKNLIELVDKLEINDF